MKKKFTAKINGKPRYSALCTEKKVKYPKKTVTVDYILLRKKNMEHYASIADLRLKPWIKKSFEKIINSIKKAYPLSSYLIMTPHAPLRKEGSTESDTKSHEGELLRSCGFKYSNTLLIPGWIHRNSQGRDIYYFEFKNSSKNPPPFKFINLNKCTNYKR